MDCLGPESVWRAMERGASQGLSMHLTSERLQNLMRSRTLSYYYCVTAANDLTDTRTCHCFGRTATL